MCNEKKTAGETAMQVYTYNDKDVQLRTKVIDGNPWFVAKDLCEILELEDVRRAVEPLDEDEKLTGEIFQSGQMRSMWLVNESGLYALVIRSRKPEAKKFRKWVTSEVLPSIRKTGRYEVGASSSSSAVVRHPRRSRSELVNAELLNLLWLIGESLQQGEIREVALELGVSRQTVSKVLNGYARNPRVLMALYQRAKANRACGVIYHRPEVMAERLIDAENGDVVVQLPPVVYGKPRRGGQPGNQNARKWQKGGVRV